MHLLSDFKGTVFILCEDLFIKQSFKIYIIAVMTTNDFYFKVLLL